MDLTLHRRDERRERRTPSLPSPAGPAGVLLASCGLAAFFVLAVSDLITRLG